MLRTFGMGITTGREFETCTGELHSQRVRVGIYVNTG